MEKKQNETMEKVSAIIEEAMKADCVGDDFADKVSDALSLITDAVVKTIQPYSARISPFIVFALETIAKHIEASENCGEAVAVMRRMFRPHMITIDVEVLERMRGGGADA